MNERIMDDGNAVVNGDIKFGPFSNPRMNAVLKHFGKTAFGRSSACMEFENFLKQVGANGKCCLEIGTFHGITAIVLSQFFAKVVCVSIDDPNAKLLKHELVDFLGITNIEFHDFNDNAAKARFIGRLDFDFCYQDGDHTNDTDTDFALVERCGRVLFHEYWPLQAPVWNLVNSLPQHEVTRAQFDCLAYWHKQTKENKVQGARCKVKAWILVLLSSCLFSLDI